MANLSELLGKRTAQPEEPKNEKAETRTAPTTQPESGAGSVAEPGQAAESGSAAKPANPFARLAPVAQPQSAEPVRETLKDSEPTATPPQAAPKLAGIFGKALPATPEVPASTIESKSIGSAADLDDLDMSGIQEIGLDDTGAAVRSQFADETPALKPTREIPADLDKQSRQFIDLLDGVYDQLHDPELLGQVIPSIMVELKSNPQYKRHIADEDVRVWIRTMRESMGLAKIKKIETKAKRATGGTSRSKKVVDTDIMADLDSLGLDL